MLFLLLIFGVVIDLPSRHHRWYVTNSSVAWIDGVMGTTHALNLGFTDIIVEDIRVSGHIQTSSMHVVIPHKLSLYLVPVTNASIPLQGITPIPASNIWYVFPGQEYAISVKAFADESDANEIHITEVIIYLINSLSLQIYHSYYSDNG